MRPPKWSQMLYRARVLAKWSAPALCGFGVTSALCAAAPTAVTAALREPPPLTREQVRSGLAERAEQMRIRQEKHNQRREVEPRYRVGPRGRPDFRVPRDPRPVPPPDSLP